MELNCVVSTFQSCSQFVGVRNVFLAYFNPFNTNQSTLYESLFSLNCESLLFSNQNRSIRKYLLLTEDIMQEWKTM